MLYKHYSSRSSTTHYNKINTLYAPPPPLLLASNQIVSSISYTYTAHEVLNIHWKCILHKEVNQLLKDNRVTVDPYPRLLFLYALLLKPFGIKSIKSRTLIAGLNSSDRRLGRDWQACVAVWRQSQIALAAGNTCVRDASVIHGRYKQSSLKEIWFVISEQLCVSL